MDWLLRLPDGLSDQFAQELRTFEEERQMTYITSIEELGIEKGRIEGRAEGRGEGLIEGIAGMLDLKFGEVAQSVIAELQLITNLNTLERLIAHIKPAQTLDEIRHIYAPTTNGN
jgi:predicted transposase YdaD